MKKIAVLTSGGESSGMNCVIKILFDACQKNGFSLYGVEKGYQGLIDNKFKLLTKENTENIFNKGGTFLKTSRCPDFLIEEKRLVAYNNLKKNNIDYLIVIGGNGSLKGANDFSNLFENILFLPGTIDNDICYTDQSLGYDTAVNNAVVDTVNIMDSMKSNDRGLIIETMGRHCYDIALSTAIATCADMLISKIEPFEDVLNNVKNVICQGNESPVIIVQEHTIDIEKLKEFLENNISKTFKTTVLGYIQRGGAPTVADRLLATELAVKAISLIKENKNKLAIGKLKGEIVTCSLSDACCKNNVHENSLLQVFNQLKK